MQFVNNLNSLILDDQYFLNVPFTEGADNVPTGNVGLVGTFSRGPLNTPMRVTSYPELVKLFGDVSADLTGAVAARGVFQQGNANVYAVRVDSAAHPAKTAECTINSGESDKPALKLKAKTPGTWANDMMITFEPAEYLSSFTITLDYGMETEKWENVYLRPETLEPLFGEQGRSALISIEMLTQEVAELDSIAPSTYILNGGSNGEDATASDYIGSSANGKKTGLKALDNAPVNLVFCAEQTDATLNEELVKNADAITAHGGTPRLALITFPRNTTVTMLETFSKNAYLNSSRAIAVFPWLNIADGDGRTRVVSPLGYFAGVLAQLDPHQSTGNKPIAGILGADPQLILGPDELSRIVAARVNPVGVQTPSGVLGIRSGLTHSNQENLSQIYAVRMTDYINQQISAVGGLFVDQPITDDLMRQVYHVVDNILRPMKSPISPSDQMIADYKIVCDSTNNSAQSIAQNRLVCDYAVKLLNVSRFLIFRTQIGAGVVVTKQA